jgi:hypothetical protein
VTARMREEIRGRRRQGQTIGRIAIETRLSPGQVRSALYPLPNGAYRHPRPAAISRQVNEHAAQIVQWWAAGYTAPEIALMLGWTTYQAQHAIADLRRRGWNLPVRRPGGGRQLADAA